ncbi:MAG: AsmA-like C-terminal region-containing protein [Vicinamibacterales bacterium]
MRRKLGIIIAGLVVSAFAAGAIVVSRRSADQVHSRIVQSLSRGLDSEVTLEGVEVGVLPRPYIKGRGLVIRHLGRSDVPPLIVVREFTTHTSWSRLFDKDVDEVHLDGLEVTIPPGRRKDMPQMGGRSVEPSRVIIRRLLAHDARLTVMPKNAKKNPRVFDLFDLTMSDLAFDRQAAFKATLTNPIPFGTIETQGTFGPWAATEPRETPLSGAFTFSADLSTIKGIAGSLASTGRYTGTIERVVTSGDTQTPDFRIPTLNAVAMPLSTSYDALVDGANGDVELTRVDVRLGASKLQATGNIVGTKGVKGKRVLLRLKSQDARMEDVLSLTVRRQPPAMTGQVQLDASFDLPQGDRDVVEKIRLDGRVSVKTARFTVDRIQDKVDELSRRGRGRPTDQSISDVASDFSTAFRVEGGMVTLTGLTYNVSGASVALAGTYALESGALDFNGDARLVASASATQTGVKRVLLMPFDFLFRKDGAGTLVGINVTGTVDHPRVGVDLLRRKKGK